MYVVEVNGKITAFHKKKKVLKKYLKNYRNTNPKDDVFLLEIDDDIESDIFNEDLYLVPCNETYIQQRYIDNFYLTSEYDDKVRLESQLKRLLKENLTVAEKKTLLQVLEIVKSRRKEAGAYTPSLEHLSEIYWMYEEWKNNIY